MADNVALIALGISGVGLLVSIASGMIAYRAKEQTRRHTEIIQRAYLSVEPGGIQERYDRDDRIRGYVICRNRGHLPARKLSWHTRTDTVQQEGEQFPIGEMSEPRGVVTPGTEMIVSAGTFFTSKLENSLFVWGVVTYDDGFGTRRYTKFCHRYYTKPFYGAGTFSMPPDAGEIYEYGNDAD
jgi:hypothetical protein